MSAFSSGQVPSFEGGVPDAEVVLGADGHFYVAYLQPEGSGITVERWVDDAWEVHAVVSTFDLRDDLFRLKDLDLAITSTGTIALATLGTDVEAYEQLGYATYADGEWRYSTVDSVDPESGEHFKGMSLTLDANDIAHVAAVQFAPENAFVAKYFKAYEYGGSEPAWVGGPVLDPTTDQLRDPHVEIDEQGRPFIVLTQLADNPFESGLVVLTSENSLFSDTQTHLMAPLQYQGYDLHFTTVTQAAGGYVLALGQISSQESLPPGVAFASYQLGAPQGAVNVMPLPPMGTSTSIGPAYYQQETDTLFFLARSAYDDAPDTITIFYVGPNVQGGGIGNTLTLPDNFAGAAFTFSVDADNQAMIVAHDAENGELIYYVGPAYYVHNVTGEVVIEGTLQAGQTLTANTSGLEDPDGLGAFSYQWQADGTDIVGATASTFKLTAAEVGKVITVVVSYTDESGTPESVSSLESVIVIEAPALPPVTPPLVDGVPVVVTPGTSPDGTPTHTVTIPVVQPGRPDSNGASPLADIPLVTTGGKMLLEAKVPAGYGLTVSGPSGTSTGAQSLAELIREIKAHTAAGSSDQNALTGGGTSFLSGLDASSPLLVQTIVPTAVPTSGNERLVINSTATTDGGVPTALVIDASSLSAPLNLEGNGVEFFALIGHIDLLGGADTQSVWGDSGEQTVRLGTGQATVMTGGGNDTIVGSFGGGAADSASARVASLAETMASASLFHGGADEDVVRYDLASGQVVITRDFAITTVRALSDPDAVHVLINVESIAFSDKTVKVENDVSLGWIAGLYDQVLGRQAEVDGIQYWAHQHADGMSAGEIALQFLRSAEADRVLNTGTATARGITVEAFYEGLLGRASDAAGKAYWANELAKGASLADVAGAFLATAEGQGTALDQTEWNFFV